MTIILIVLILQMVCNTILTLKLVELVIAFPMKEEESVQAQIIDVPKQASVVDPTNPLDNVDLSYEKKV
jgi:hypothetical protein